MELKLQLHELLMELPGLLSRSRGFSPAHKPNLPVCHSPRPAHLSHSLHSSFLPPPPWQRRASKTRLLSRPPSSKASDLLACTRPACWTRPRRRPCSPSRPLLLLPLLVRQQCCLQSRGSRFACNGHRPGDGFCERGGWVRGIRRAFLPRKH